METGIDCIKDAQNIALLNKVLRALLKKGILTKADIEGEAEERNITGVV